MRDLFKGTFALLAVACTITGAFKGSVLLMALAVPVSALALVIQLRGRTSQEKS